MKNKKIISILLLAAVIFLYACNESNPGEAVPVDEEIPLSDGYAEEEEIEIETDEEEPEEELDINELTHLGYFTIETLKGEEPVQNEDGTMTLPGGGFITTAENASRFEVTSGAVLEFDDINSPYKLYINAPFKLLGNDRDIIIESPDGFAITIDGLEEQYRKGSGRELRVSPWVISFDSDTNAIFEFKANDIKFISLDSVFPMYKDEHNGVILFKKCRIELADGTIIDAPLNTKAQIDENEFTIIIGESNATMTKADGTVSTIPSGTVFNSNFEIII